jgi:flagellin
MSLTINTNLASLNAQRNLDHSQASLTTSLQRLSSGLRINSAKDDAAGLSISERMGSQIRGLNQAARNANDAISLAQTTEGNLSEISNVLQRIREIAVQSANDTNTTADRTSLQNEVTSLTAEIDRIAGSAQFNGSNLLDGSFSSKTFQVGANSGQSIAVAISGARNSDLGLTGSATVSVAGSTAALSFTPTTTTISGIAIGSLSDDGVSYVGATKSGATSTLAIANAINAQTTTGVSAKATTSVTSAAITDTGRALATVAGEMSINGVDIGALAAAASVADRSAQLIVAINAKSGSTGVVATAASLTTYTLTAADGRNIAISSTATATTDGHSTAANIATATGFAVSNTVAITNYGQLTLTAGKNIVVAGAAIGTASPIAIGTYVKSGSSTVDVSSQILSSSAISQIDSAIDTINTQRATLGTVQSRFESVIANLKTSSENVSAARGRIRDTDFAAETANMTRNQVLQQAGVAMLAQANALPNIVLSLLK